MKYQIFEYENEKYTIIIGENAKDNWNIIDMADQNDIWFHINNIPSPHIILKSNGKKINEINK